MCIAEELQLGVGGRAISAPDFLLYFALDKLTGSFNREGDVRMLVALAIGRQQLRSAKSRGCRSKAPRAAGWAGSLGPSGPATLHNGSIREAPPFNHIHCVE